MTRITRTAALVIAFAAAGSAFAESPNASEYVQSTAASVSTAPRAEARFVGVTNDFTGYHAAPLTQGRSRADVRAETQAAIASGELQAQGGEFALQAYGHAAPKAQRAAAGQTLAQLGR